MANLRFPQRVRKFTWVKRDWSCRSAGLPYIEGDGIGVDISAMIAVLDAAVEKAYGGRKIAWMEIYAGEKAVATYGNDTWLPNETLDAVNEFTVAIKGPLTTPVGGGIRSLNVALRQLLDLYVCQRPVRWFEGVPSPVKRPDLTDMVIFRENSEDIYAGVEYQEGTPEVKEVIDFLQDKMGVAKFLSQTSGIDIKPFLKARTVFKAYSICDNHNRESVLLVHETSRSLRGAFTRLRL